ncbi:quinoprotein dehydrogenase-associated SoxYZ-like carrier [Novosphingobium resinovorum]|uniref:Quinoprotein dehydrogenase-associated SoxYZ-like carrier n=1 Tax=Novosphingobium resinovorum TaxID=158500 RepID=A0A1D8A7K9_9SPHN|nr:quinoprotein dehydrogenase-associated SoxYZ-like carrier [Novosphingobium resinovorum]AOR78099.1 quinoprotein dehydrogenase-associated SoxYZ-like carrier [Novosphingobium resinovorum]
MIRKKILLALIATLAAPVPAAFALPADPLKSPMWEYHAERLFGDATVRFDSAVKVEIPEIAENQRVFPVTVDARALPDVKRILIFADLNPIPVAVDYAPRAAAPFLATRIKLDQRTPVRAAVLTTDGVWHVSGNWIDAAGGGCSAPPVSRVKGDWANHLGEMHGAAWALSGTQTRLRVTLRHPMDTGLVENIAAYNIERVTVTSSAGTPLADLQVFGAVAEDPAFTFIVDDAKGPLSIAARDSSGLEFDGTVTPRSAALAAR